MSTWKQRLRHPLSSARGGVRTWYEQHNSHPRGRNLFTGAWAAYRANLFPILGVVLVVIIPAGLLTSYAADPSGDTALSAYIAFAELAMNAALIYALVEIMGGRKVGIREAYYRGSHAIVRLVLVALLMAIMVIPLSLGLLIFSAGILNPGAQLVLMEKILLTALAIAVSLPTVVWLLRGFMSLYVIFEEPHGPWQAIRRSFGLTKGKTVLVLRRALLLIAALCLVLVIPTVVLAALGAYTGYGIFIIILQILIAAVVLPIANLYFYNLYRSFK